MFRTAIKNESRGMTRACADAIGTVLDRLSDLLKLEVISPLVFTLKGSSAG